MPIPHPDGVAALDLIEAPMPTRPRPLATQPPLDVTVAALTGRSGLDHRMALWATLPYRVVPALAVRDARDGMPTVVTSAATGPIPPAARSCPARWGWLQGSRASSTGDAWPDPDGPVHHWLRVARNGAAVRVFGADELFGVGPVLAHDVAAHVAAAVTSVLPFPADSPTAPVMVRVVASGRVVQAAADGARWHLQAT